MIEIKIEGLDKLDAGLRRIVPETQRRLAAPAKESAQVIAQEGNRRIHSPRGHARTFRVYTTSARAVVSPGSRANFFSQRFRPMLQAAIDATHSRVEEIVRKAVEQVVRMEL